MKPKFNYSVHNAPSLAPVLNPMTPIHFSHIISSKNISILTYLSLGLLTCILPQGHPLKMSHEIPYSHVNPILLDLTCS